MKILAVVGNTVTVLRENIRGKKVIQHVEVSDDIADKARNIIRGPQNA